MHANQLKVKSLVKQGKSWARAALPFAMFIALCGAPAQAVVFHDPGNTYQSIINSIAERTEMIRQELNQQAQLGNDVRQLSQQLTQLQNAMTRLQGLLSGSFGVDSNLLSNLQLVDLNAGADVRCPQNGGGPAGFMSSVARRVLGLEDRLFKQQQETCIATVQAENARFNNIVQLMKRLDDRNRELEGIRADTPGNDSTEGAVGGHLLTMNQYAEAMSMDINSSMAQSQIYDSFIASLNTQQMALGQQAFSGKGKFGLESLTSAMVQGALLKAALEVGD